MSRYDVAIIGSGFAGSLLARILARQGHSVALIERGTHPRFAIGESSTPLASLSLERIARRYNLPDCYHLATHGRWLTHLPELRRGLKRGFTFYRHHPGEAFENRGLTSERLLVAASPNDFVADTHWLRADVDHHMVREAIAASVAYRDQVELASMELRPDGVHLAGLRGGVPFALDAGFVVDASGGNGFVARQLEVPSALDQVRTHSALLFSHFDGVRLVRDMVPGLPDGPYPDDLAAVHHIIDEGWMYSLRFDDGVTSAGFALTPEGLRALEDEVGGANAAHESERKPAAAHSRRAERLWHQLMRRYPTIGTLFGSAAPRMPITLQPRMQHRLTHAAGDGWALLPSAYAFVDPLFSTGIAWSLRAVERLARCFEISATTTGGARAPSAQQLAHYDSLLSREADQIDLLVAGAYEAMPRFDDFVAQSMLYFATVSFAEAHERLIPGDEDPWTGFLGVDDPILAPLPSESVQRLCRLRARDERTYSAARPGTASDNAAGGRAALGNRDVAGPRVALLPFATWVTESIAPRNIAALADPARHNLYPADLEALVDRHALLGLTRDQVVAGLPALRGMAPPDFS
ncbi:MAG: FAD-dependent monooxygenase [Gemmatimonadota bacterium]